MTIPTPPSPLVTPGTSQAVSSGDEQRTEAQEQATKIPTRFSGHALAVTEGNAITLQEPAQKIVLIGPIASGKTTLVLSIYDEFRKGSFGKAAFAGSRTLLGFEERCHLSREASQGRISETERTKADSEEILLHIRVANDSGIVNLIFCDLSGELFEAGSQATEALLRIPFLRTASHFVMIVDGQKLEDGASRHVIRQDFLTIFRACIEAGRINNSSSVAVVFSKQDCVHSSRTKTEIEEFQNALERECIDRFENRVDSLRFYRITARPRADGDAESLFQSWLKPVSIYSVPRKPEAPPTRQIDRLQPI